jgi:uncharacterized protein (TIGR02285 family)
MKRFLAILLFVAGGAKAGEPDDILWILPDFPPLFITERDLQGQGYGDGELRYLIRHLPQFHHVTLNGTAHRLWHEMETRDGVCAISAAKIPEREKFAIFTARAVYGASNKVIVRSDKLHDFAPYLDKSDQIDLVRLAADDHLLGAYSDGTTYGPAIDSFIKDPQRKTPLELTPHLRMPLALLEKGRLDFVFGYFMEMAYFQRTHQVTAAFTALSTTSEPVRQDSYVACSKGPRGRQVIAAIDALLSHDEAMLDFVDNLRGWYSPAEFEIAQKLAQSGAH